MKTLLVFLAMLLVLSSLYIFIEDSNNYIKLQKSLKALAEECAGGGALFVSEKSTKNNYVVDTDAARAYAEFIAANHKNSLACLSSSYGTVNVSLSTFTNASGNSCTKALCTWLPNKDYRLFRLPFVPSPQKVEQSSVYELKK